MNCPFCPPLKDRVIDSDHLTVTTRDGYPVSPGHTLIIPVRHFPSFFDATQEERLALWTAVTTARTVLDAEFSPDGYNIGINDGKVAGQTVMHLHIHLIPRYAGDRDDPRGGVRWVIPEKADYWSRK